jgi:NitT/TauT family transport system permease protein
MTLSRIPTWCLVIASISAGAIAWEVVGGLELSLIFPPLSDVLSTVYDVWTSDRFREALGETLTSLAIGWPLSVGLGIVVGVLMGRFKVVEWALDIYVNIFLSIPLIALIPIILLLFGLGRPSIVVVVFLATFFQVVINTSSGIRAVSSQYEEMARSFGSNEFQKMVRITIPGALPLMLTGVRIATGRCVRSVIFAEQLISVIGLGGLLQSYGGALRVEETWALIIAIAILGLGGMEAIRYVEGLMLRHFPQGHQIAGAQ